MAEGAGGGILGREVQGPGGGPTVRRLMDVDETGEYVMAVLPKYSKLCRDAEKVFAAFLSSNGIAAAPPASITTREMIQIAVDALAINYRVSILELAML